MRSWSLCHFLALALSFVGFASTVAAETREWVLLDPPTQPTCPTHPSPACIWYGEGPFSNPFLQREPSALIRRIATRFDQSTRVWEFELIVGRNPAFPSGIVPTSFWMVMNHGPMPMQLGMASIVYFDGTIPSSPTLSVYGYNNGHDLFDRSWEDGNRQVSGIQESDRICNSRVSGNCGSWVQELKSEVDASTGDHLFRFRVDAAPILNHTPRYTNGGNPPAPWHSPSNSAEPRIFDSQVGIWLHMGGSRSYDYDQSGFISAVDEAAQKGFDPVALYYDREFIRTNGLPTCSSTLAQNTLRPGETVQWEVTGVDPDDGIVAVTGSGAVTCVDEILPDRSGRRQCSFTAPNAPGSDGTMVKELSTFTDKSGAVVSCSDKLTVINHPPSCELVVSAAQPIACEGATTTVPLQIATFDGDQDPVSTNFQISCSAGTGSISTQNGVVASVTGPGAGTATSCAVTATVSDGFDAASCNATFAVNPCELDCAGTPLGGAVRDQCGVCNGTNSCIDCAGTPFGTSTTDRCGVCGGDGTSCLGCKEVDSKSQLLALDGAAFAAKVRVVRAIALLRRLEHYSRAGSKFARDTQVKAAKSYVAAWQQTWTFPLTVTSCTNSTFCTNAITSGSVADVQKSFDTLASLHAQVVRRIARYSKTRAKSLTAAFAVTRKDFAARLAAAPSVTSICFGSGD